MDRQQTARALAKVHAYLDCGDDDRAAQFAAMLIDALHEALPMARAYERRSTSSTTYSPMGPRA